MMQNIRSVLVCVQKENWPADRAVLFGEVAACTGNECGDSSRWPSPCRNCCQQRPRFVAPAVECEDPALAVADNSIELAQEKSRTKHGEISRRGLCDAKW